MNLALTCDAQDLRAASPKWISASAWAAAPNVRFQEALLVSLTGNFVQWGGREGIEVP